MQRFFTRALAYNSIGISVLCAISSLIVLYNLQEEAKENNSAVEEIRNEMLGYIKLSVGGVIVGGVALLLERLAENDEQVEQRHRMRR